MRKVHILAYSLLLLSACDCTPEPPPKVVEDALITLMTTGEWAITNFAENATNYTTDYSGWRFKFFTDKTVNATFNGNLVNTGTWDGSYTSMTFTANFPGAVLPVTRIIGTWNVSATSSRIVEATTTVGTTVKVMKLYRE